MSKIARRRAMIFGSSATVADTAPGNRPTSSCTELNAICRTADLLVLTRSPYQHYDNIVMLREPKHALVPSGSLATVAGTAPGNRPTSNGTELNAICRTADLPVFTRSPYQQYDRIVVLREPKHALVPSGKGLSAKKYAVNYGSNLLKFNE